jgi:hypothetical protein
MQVHVKNLTVRHRQAIGRTCANLNPYPGVCLKSNLTSQVPPIQIYFPTGFYLQTHFLNTHQFGYVLILLVCVCRAGHLVVVTPAPPGILP